MRFIVFLLISVSFTFSCSSQSFDEKIVLINVGDYDRGAIARMISEINLLNPQVVALDIAFPDYTGSQSDKLLYLALMDVKKLVLPSKVSSLGRDYYDREMILVSLACASEFRVPNSKTGFVSSKVANDQLKIPEDFAVWQDVYFGNYKSHHFSIMTAMSYDSLKTINFIESHERMVNIDNSERKREFKMFSAEEVLKGMFSKSDIEGKIVMMGYLGPGDHDRYVTSLSKSAKKSKMYGLEYLANIVAQVLEYDIN